MLKPFNGHKGVIREIKNNEVSDLLDIAKRYNLDITYLDIFKNSKDGLCDIAIDDNKLGGHVSALAYHYVYELINPNKLYIFNTVADLKKYIEKIEQREEQKFLVIQESKEYQYYLNTLDINELEKEYYYVRSVNKYNDIIYSRVRKRINHLTHLMKFDYEESDVSDKNIKHYLKILSRIITFLDEVNDISIYKINKEGYSKNTNDVEDKEEMMRYLKHVHNNDEYAPYVLRNIEKNLVIIYHLFNYKLFLECKVSYDHHAYDVLRDIGLKDGIPLYLVGEKINGAWDYKKAIERFIYTLSIYNYNPIRSNEHVLLYAKGVDRAKEVVDKVLSLGYSLDEFFNNIGYDIKGVIVAPYKRKVSTSSSETILACMCTAFNTTGLDPDKFLNNIDKIIINYDFVYYNKLLKER